MCEENSGMHSGGRKAIYKPPAGVAESSGRLVSVGEQDGQGFGQWRGRGEKPK